MSWKKRLRSIQFEEDRIRKEFRKKFKLKKKEDLLKQQQKKKGNGKSVTPI